MVFNQQCVLKWYAKPVSIHPLVGFTSSYYSYLERSYLHLLSAVGLLPLASTALTSPLPHPLLADPPSPPKTKSARAPRLPYGGIGGMRMGWNSRAALPRCLDNLIKWDFTHVSSNNFACSGERFLRSTGSNGRKISSRVSIARPALPLWRAYLAIACAWCGVIHISFITRRL